MMQKTFSLCLLGLLAATLTSAEKPSNPPVLMGTDTLGTPIPRDTSFTLHGTYLKELIYRPHLLVAEVRPPAVLYLDQEYDRVGNRPLFLDVCCPDGASSKRYPGGLWIHGAGVQSRAKPQMHTIG